MNIKNFQFVNWFPAWKGVGRWKYPRSRDDITIFKGILLGFWEIRIFNKKWLSK